MKSILIINFGKLLSYLIQVANLGNGSTWPGHLALKADRSFINKLLQNSPLKTVFIIGTNGKTTTTGILRHILETNNDTVIQNQSGANLLNGIASTLLLNTNFRGKISAKYALFEIDENAFPGVCEMITPDTIVCLNLFRDQLDRYGEVNTISLKWKEVLEKLPSSTHLILNADDPQIAFLGANAKQKITYFGLKDPHVSLVLDHASDSTFCPNCGTKLTYTNVFYSHLGVWKCPNCKFTRAKILTTTAPSYPLEGKYNRYNVIAASVAASVLGIAESVIKSALCSFKPAFGRQEKIPVGNKTIEIILAKNPAGFNQSLQTIKELGAQTILFVLNDRIADGRDVSWIWDVDFEMVKDFKKGHFVCSGDRADDLALRFKYAELSDTNTLVERNLASAITQALDHTPEGETLFILPTYTAMLEVRKILTGKKIL